MTATFINLFVFLRLMIYEPREDSFLIQKHIKKYAKGRVLDMGSGSGILAEEASKYADVTAVDIQSEVVKHLKSKNIVAVQSDLFENITGKFDLIIFNPPYLPDDSRVRDVCLDGGPEGYELIARFLADAKKYLNTGGKILLLFSSLSKKVVIDKLLADFTFEQIDNQKLDFEELYVYKIE